MLWDQFGRSETEIPIKQTYKEVEEVETSESDS